MEPVHGGRDDPSRWRRPGGRRRPQWSPSTEDGTTCAALASLALSALPQWSPSTEDGTTGHGVLSSSMVIVPQWSPSTEDGTTESWG